MLPLGCVLGSPLNPHLTENGANARRQLFQKVFTTPRPIPAHVNGEGVRIGVGVGLVWKENIITGEQIFYFGVDFISTGTWSLDPSILQKLLVLS